MRISELEKSVIIHSFKLHLQYLKWKLFLFGSRTNDDFLGGDIDILLLVESPQDLQLALRARILILIEIKNKIGEQKIDLLIKSEADQDSFVTHILQKAILLFQNNIET